MFNFEDLLSASSDFPEAESFEMIWELFFNDDFVCYTNSSAEQFDMIAHNFLQYHARVPSPLGGHLVAQNPMFVIAFDLSTPDVPQDLPFRGSKAKAAVFHNGAIALFEAENITDKILLVDKYTASFWNYPEDGQFSLASYFPKRKE